MSGDGGQAMLLSGDCVFGFAHACWSGDYPADPWAAACCAGDNCRVSTDGACWGTETHTCNIGAQPAEVDGVLACYTEDYVYVEHDTWCDAGTDVACGVGEFLENGTQAVCCSDESTCNFLPFGEPCDFGQWRMCDTP